MAYPPQEPADCVTTIARVYSYFNQFLGRPPRDDNDAIGYGRIGLPCQDVIDEIWNSQEAQNYRNRKASCEGTPGMVWVENGQGGACIMGAQTPPPPPPPPPGTTPPPTTGIPPLDNLIAWLRSVFDAKDEILRKLAEQVAAVAKTAGDAASGIKDQVAANLSKYLTPIADVMGKFQATVGNLVQGLVPTTLSLVGAALGGVETIAAAFLNNAASIEDITSHIGSVLSDKKVDIGAFLLGAIGGAFESGLMGAVDAFTRDHPEIATHTIDVALTIPDLSPRTRELLTTARDREHSPGALVSIGVLVSVAVGIMGALAEPDVENARQYGWHLNPTRTMDLSDVLDARARGFIDEPTARELSTLQGLRPQLLNLYTRIRQRQVELDAVYAAKFRGAITEDEAHARLIRLGFEDESITVLDEVMQNIPNVSDVLRFLVRDVFIPEFVETFGMDKEYPPDADVWAKKLGIPHEVMMLHWRAHWDLPSVTQGYEMFQRGKIDETALRRLLRAQGVEPYWRDPLIAVSYNPLTRVDLRRMDKIGTITDAQLMQGYRDIGYSPEQAKLLFDFTKAYNKGDKPKVLTDLTDSLRGRVVTAVMSATITESEGTKLLGDIGYSSAEIAAFITEARLLRQEAISRKVADLVGALYVKGHRTETEARAALGEHGYVAGEIDLIMREWNLEKELHTPTPAELKQKDLSAANVLTAFIDGAMTETEARGYLTYLRYDAKEAAVLIAEAKYKIAAQEEKDAIEAIHVGVLSGRTDEADASAALSALNIPTKKRDALLAKWSLERHGKVEKIPLSSLKDLLSRAIWDDAKMTTYLQETGYSAHDIEALLILWGSQAAERKAKEAAAAAKALAKAGAAGKKP